MANFIGVVLGLVLGMSSIDILMICGWALFGVCALGLIADILNTQEKYKKKLEKSAKQESEEEQTCQQCGASLT